MNSKSSLEVHDFSAHLKLNRLCNLRKNTKKKFKFRLIWYLLVHMLEILEYIHSQREKKLIDFFCYYYQLLSGIITLTPAIARGERKRLYFWLLNFATLTHSALTKLFRVQEENKGKLGLSAGTGEFQNLNVVVYKL